MQVPSSILTRYQTDMHSQPCNFRTVPPILYQRASCLRKGIIDFTPCKVPFGTDRPELEVIFGKTARIRTLFAAV